MESETNALINTSASADAAADDKHASYVASGAAQARFVPTGRNATNANRMLLAEVSFQTSFWPHGWPGMALSSL